MAYLLEPKIIYTEERVGKGIDTDPVRLVQQWYSPDGTLLLSFDPHTDETWGTRNMINYLTSLGESN